ncbi:MAG: RodZ domain-containing protein [Phascolarctobacterium sp.]
MDTEKSVGTLLREARLAKGLSLAEAEQGTSIRARYLEALEKDEYDKTPGEVFMKGMLRNYGNFLGLNGPELVQLYKASAAGMAKEAVKSAGIREVDKVKLNIQLKNPRDIGSGTGKLELPSLPKMPSFDMRQVMAGVAVLAVLAAGYFAVPKAINYFQNRPQPVAVETQRQDAAAKAPVVWDKVQVKMEANGDCWLEVLADGKEIFAGMMRAKDQKSFEAKDKLIVKYGNIGVMKLEVNGESVDLKGEHGVQVKTYTRPGAVSEAAPVQASKPAASVPAKKVEASKPEATPAPEAKPAAKPADTQPAASKPQANETKAAQPAEPKAEQAQAKAKQ